MKWLAGCPENTLGPPFSIPTHWTKIQDNATVGGWALWVLYCETAAATGPIIV